MSGMVFVKMPHKSLEERWQDDRHKLWRHFGGEYQPSSREVEQLQAQNWKRRMSWRPPQQAAQQATLSQEDLDKAVNSALGRIKKKREMETESQIGQGFE
jgi:hypothetical protein